MALIDPTKFTSMRRVYEQAHDDFLNVGSIVHTRRDPDKTFRVIKVNPKNLVLFDTDGKQWTLDRRAALLAPRGTQHEEPVKALPPVKLGSVVRFLGNAARRAGEGPWVCIKQPDERARAKFVELGGTSSMIWTVHVESTEIWEGTWC